MSSFRDLPSIDVLLRAGDHLTARYGHARTVEALRQAVEAARQALAAGSPLPDRDTLLAQAEAHLSQASRPTLRPVINATGVIIHQPRPRAALRQAIAACRRSRAGTVRSNTTSTAGRAGSATCTTSACSAGDRRARQHGRHNNAAGVLLALSALAAGRRRSSAGEQVEIGGAFRIPDVMRQSGARMVEVGTTNRTHLSDYADVITPETAAIVRAHPSNFRVIGFTESVPLSDLAVLAHEHDLVLIHDLGSGALLDTTAFGLAHSRRCRSGSGRGPLAVQQG